MAVTTAWATPKRDPSKDHEEDAKLERRAEPEATVVLVGGHHWMKPVIALDEASGTPAFCPYSWYLVASQ
jgi:hypothetical protein